MAHIDPPTGAGAPATMLSDAELEMLHKDDRQAARTIVILLTAIFLTGILLYIGVCIAVSS